MMSKSKPFHMILHILQPESTAVHISSSDLVWSVNLACLINDEEGEEAELR